MSLSATLLHQPLLCLCIWFSFEIVGMSSAPEMMIYAGTAQLWSQICNPWWVWPEIIFWSVSNQRMYFSHSKNSLNDLFQ